MFALLASLAIAGNVPLTADQARGVRCIAVLGIIAFEQERGTAAALALPPLADDGARFAAVAGEALVRETGRTREQVRDLILAEVSAARASAALPIDEARACVPLMRSMAPPEPPSPATEIEALPEPVR